MTNEEAAYKIVKYIDEEMQDPHKSWSGYEQMLLSYSQWAAYELVNLLLDNPFGNPISTIDYFLLKMELYYRSSKNEKSRLVFLRALKTAEEIGIMFV